MIFMGNHLHLGKLVSRDLEDHKCLNQTSFWEIFKIVDLKSLI